MGHHRNFDEKRWVQVSGSGYKFTMIKVEVCAGEDGFNYEELENYINNFLEEKNILRSNLIDIKFSTTINGTQEELLSALIIYEV